MAKQMSKCGLNVPHKDGELTNEQHLINARAIEDWANFLVASESGCLNDARSGRIHFDMGPGLVSQITSAPYRAVGAETYTSFEATLNTAPSTGDVDVAIKKNGSTQTTITVDNAATTEDHTYTLTLADGDIVTMEVTDGNGSGAEGLHIIMVP